MMMIPPSKVPPSALQELTLGSYTQTSTWYTQVASVQRRLRTCFPALFPPLWNSPRLYSSQPALARLQ